MPHLEPNVALDYLLGLLDPDEREPTEQHLAQCDGCQAMVLAALRQSVAGAEANPPPAPVQVGRFTVLRALGSGAMGIVFAAYDPQLDRRVALKLVNVGGGPTAHQARARVLAEARAMARLSHPNVLSVHEAGEADDQLFIAMDLVEGTTLQQWLGGKRPDEVLSAFRQAGMGLAAAHRAGLVHCDFKPENVLVDGEGHVRVADFGLARMEHAATGREVRGTPAYMAPEVICGGAHSPASDQYSFCVALWEAFAGRQLFTDPGAARLAKARSPPRLEVGPSRVRHAVARGLSYEPTERFATIDALVSALAPPAPARSLAVGAALLAVTLVGTGTALLATRRRPTCDGGPERVAPLVGPERSDRLRAGLEGAGWSPTGAEGLAAKLQTTAGRWASTHRAVCEATRVSGVQSEQLLDLRMRCLERRLFELGAVVELLEAGGPGAANASTVVAGLPRAEACATAELSDEDPVPGEAAARAARLALARRVAEVSVQRLAGPMPGHLEATRALVAELGGAGAPRLLAEAELELGIAVRESGAEGHGLAELLRSERTALSALAPRVAAQAALERAFTLATLTDDFGPAEEQLHVADALLDSLDRPVELDARLLSVRAMVLSRRLKHRDASEALEGVVRLLRPSHAQSPQLAAALYNLGQLYLSLARFEEAARVQAEAVAELEPLVPAASPRLATMRVGLANALVMQGRHDEALALLDLAEPVLAPKAGRSSPGAYGMLWARASLEGELGHFARALGLAEAAVAERQAVPQTAVWRELDLAVAEFALAAGDFARVRASTRAALEGAAPDEGSTHANAQLLRARVGRLEGDPRLQAQALESLASLEQHLVFPHDVLAAVERGEAELAARRPARRWCDQARAALATHRPPPQVMARVDLLCARALRGVDPDEAKAALVRAREVYERGLMPQAELKAFTAAVGGSRRLEP